MTHDPMCPQATTMNGPWFAGGCGLCRLIAQVREDCTRKHGSSLLDTYAKGYATALRDAVEAVKALPTSNYTYSGNPPFGDGPPQIGARMVKANAVAAIEALGGER